MKRSKNDIKKGKHLLPFFIYVARLKMLLFSSGRVVNV
jgi:hypothetical protein